MGTSRWNPPTSGRLPPKIRAALLGAHPPPVILDEVQYAPDLLPYVKRAHRRPERDVRTVRQVGDLTQFQSFLRALATRSGRLLSLTDLARDLGLAVNTIKAWLSVLEATYQVMILRPYFANVGKRLVKTPRCFQRRRDAVLSQRPEGRDSRRRRSPGRRDPGNGGDLGGRENAGPSGPGSPGPLLANLESTACWGSTGSGKGGRAPPSGRCSEVRRANDASA